MNFLNIGILAHVDAGKTSLTERLLFDAGVIARVGSVDAGSTQTDSLDLERRRGITIRSAVVAFRVDDLQVNVIDTPGHSDFVAEVERALRVLDGAVLVVSAVEGVQARTRVLIRSLVRLRIPVLVFVNKIDRRGARYGEVLDALTRELGPGCVAMGSVRDIGTAGARFTPFEVGDVDAAADVDTGAAFAERLAEAFADHGESFVDAYLDERVTVSAADYARELRRQVGHAWTYPVFFGSAMTGEGVDPLIRGIVELLPRGRESAARAAVDGEPLRAVVLKIERGRAGEKIAYVRMRGGVLRARDAVTFHRRDPHGGVLELRGRVSAVQVFDLGTAVRDADAPAGAIAKVRGLAEVRVGDHLGSAEDLPTQGLFAPPTLESEVTLASASERPALYAALQRIAEEDPMIDVRGDEATGAISVRLYGEVQKEVIASTLAESFGLRVAFERSRALYFERPVGVGEALEEVDGDGVTFFWATVGLRIEPGPVGSGIVFGLGVELGALPLAFHRAIEESVHRTLQQGLHGWEVLDCAVTLTHTGYFSPVSAAGDFRSVTPLVVGDALRRAGTRILEPTHRFEIETPADCLGAVLSALSAARAIPEEQTASGDRFVVCGTIPADLVHGLTARLPELTRGEGVLVSEFGGYRPYTGQPIPTREHTGANPYDRERYMLHSLGRARGM
ncbi:GTP-binding protein [Embleya sp. AB8]|uniref:GTP-binding protein n=1 Tax=Embleya sp. AB8 TaxID=3156304 RepID=UPI003C743FB0